MAKFRIRKRTLKRLISAVLVTVLVASLGGALISVLSKDTKTIHPTFSVGGLDENGYYVEDKTTIYTKNAFECIGLRVEPDFESNVTYDIYFYDRAEKFIEAKKGLTKIYDEDVQLARYARIVIHPEIPEDTKADEFEIKWHQVAKYADELKIIVDRNQEDPLNVDNKDYGPNLYDATKAHDNSTCVGNKGGSIQLFWDEPDMNPNSKCSEKISLDPSYEYVDIIFRFNGNVSNFGYCIVSDDDIVRDSICYTYNNDFFKSLVKDELVTVTVDIKELQTLYDDLSLYFYFDMSYDEVFVFGY